MRARNIKPDFYSDEDLIECSIMARWLAPGLWMMADKEGRLEDKPRKIKIKLAPVDDINIDALLTELEKKGKHIIRYEVDGERYIQIVNFHKHQTPHCKEKPSTIPAPYKHHTSTVQKPPDSLIPDSLIPDSNTPPYPPKKSGGDGRAAKSFKQWTRDDLTASVKENNADNLLLPEEVTDFIDYWMEPTPKGRPKLSKEGTWDTRRRMHTAVKIVYKKNRRAPPQSQASTDDCQKYLDAIRAQQ